MSDAPLLDPERSAAVAGLRYVNDQQMAGFQRRGRVKRFRYLRADRELAADEWALRHLEADGPHAYGQTLLKVLTAHSQQIGRAHV